MNLKKRIRIGIEGKALGKIRDGIFNVTISLLKEMIKNPDFEFVVFSPYDLLPEELEGKVGHVKGGSFTRNPGVWFHLDLPVLLRQNPVDILWEPRQVLPFGIPEKTKKVMTVHDLAFMRFPETLPLLSRKNLEYMCSRSILKADVIVTVSDFTAREIYALGIADGNKKIRTIHNGVDGTQFFKDPAFPGGVDGFDFSGPYLLSVGSIEPRKNLGLLISTYEEMSSSLPDLVLVYSNTWRSGDLLERMIKGPAAPKIHLLNKISVIELRRLYSHAEALVIPSRYEGFGLPIVEAMACGCPVLASDLQVFREIAGEAALFFANNQQSLGSAIQSLSEKRVRDGMIHRGFEKAADFSWERSSIQMLDVFASLMSDAEAD